MESPRFGPFPSLCLLLVTGMLAGRPAKADSATAPIVALRVVSTDRNAELVHHVEEHLRAELSAHGVSLSIGNPAPSQRAVRVRLEILNEEDGTPTALIQLGDAVTDKRVERSIELREVPADARSLVLAACIDELLRASWSEFVWVVPQPPKPATGPKPESLATASDAKSVKVVPPSRSPPRLEFGVSAAYQAGSAQTNLGGRAQLSPYVGRKWRIATLLGFGQSLPRDSLNGQVGASYWEFGLSVMRTVWVPSTHVELRVDAGTLGQWIAYHPNATPAAVASEASDWAALLSAGLSLHVPFDTWYSALGIDGLLTVRPATAMDSGVAVMSNRGFGAAFSLGVGVKLE